MDQVHSLHAMELQKIEGALKVGVPPEYSTSVHSELRRLKTIPPSNDDYQRTFSYLDFVTSLPWNTSAPVTYEGQFLKTCLDTSHFGLTSVKEQLLEFMAMVARAPTERRPIVGLIGPPGMGKVSLALTAGKCMGLPVERINFAAARGRNFVVGESRSQSNAGPGCVMRAIARAGVNNPIIIFEELDHIDWSQSENLGVPLIHILDQRNTSFSDEYVGIPFDISQVWFIVTANSLDNVPRIIQEHMSVIEFPGYTDRDKLEIANKFLMPLSLRSAGLKEDAVHVGNDTIVKIIRRYTRESGVIQLKQCLQKIARKAAREQTPDQRDALTIKPPEVTKYLGPEWFFREEGRDHDQAGVAAGLVWTEAGGEVIYVESVRLLSGRGLILTGRLGKVMRESAETALSYLWAHIDKFPFSEEVFTESGIHVHVPAASVSKDGPSAGITILVAITSMLLKVPIPIDIAMTGEITLTGQVLPVGGIREKTLAAHRAGFKRLLLPSQNETDLQLVPSEILNELQIIFISHVREAVRLIFPKLASFKEDVNAAKSKATKKKKSRNSM